MTRMYKTFGDIHPIQKPREYFETVSNGFTPIEDVTAPDPAFRAIRKYQKQNIDSTPYFPQTMDRPLPPNIKPPMSNALYNNVSYNNNNIPSNTSSNVSYNNIPSNVPSNVSYNNNNVNPYNVPYNNNVPYNVPYNYNNNRNPTVHHNNNSCNHNNYISAITILILINIYLLTKLIDKHHR